MPCGPWCLPVPDYGCFVLRVACARFFSALLDACAFRNLRFASRRATGIHVTAVTRAFRPALCNPIPLRSQLVLPSAVPRHFGLFFPI